MSAPAFGRAPFPLRWTATVTVVAGPLGRESLRQCCLDYCLCCPKSFAPQLQTFLAGMLETASDLGAVDLTFEVGPCRPEQEATS